MNTRACSIVGWISFGLVGAFNLFAAVMKFVPVVPGSEQDLMMRSMGLTPGFEHVLGIIELIAALLLLVPRTRTVGFLLVTGYMSGALATVLTHGMGHMGALPIYISLALLTFGAFCLCPELLQRVRTGK